MKALTFRCIAASASLGALLVAVTGCTVGPNYKTPAMPTPPAFQETHATAQTATPPAIGYADWWKVFHDPTLDDLEAQAIKANTDIQIALAHVDEADATRRSVRSYQLPTIGAEPSLSRTREAQLRPNNGNTQGHAATYNDLLLPLTLNYEIDAWGRIRRMVQSATATEQATQADLHFVQLSVAASVGIDYYTLRESDAELKILDQTIVELQKGYDVTNNQFHHGIVSELDVKQAETLLEQVQAQVQALHIQRDQSEHAIAVLLGRTVEGFSIPVDATIPGPPTIPAGLPSDLLQRRPDVIAAERTAAAASAQIGVAKAAYFPQLSLTGIAGYESTNASSLLNWQNTIASLGASAAAPIFTGGRLKAGVDRAQAAYRQSVSEYEKSVLTAYQEVEDQLAAIHYLSNQAQAESSAVASARASEEIAMNRYKAGLVSYLDVVYAEQTLLDNQQTETQVDGQQMIATVVLIKALGGGWTQVNTP